MIALLALAGLAITTSLAQTAVLADGRSPTLLGPGGVVAATLAEPEPWRDHAHAAPATCPYHFSSNMPSDTFCVYRGVAFGSGGEVCATDVVVIWSSGGAQSQVRADPAAMASGSNREVYLGFVADPELVLRAVADSRHGDRAEMVGYTVGSAEAPQPLAGETTLRTVHLKSSETADMLSMELREPRRFRPRGCAFASYSGTFMGVIAPEQDASPGR